MDIVKASFDGSSDVGREPVRVGGRADLRRQRRGHPAAAAAVHAAPRAPRTARRDALRLAPPQPHAHPVSEHGYVIHTLFFFQLDTRRPILLVINVTGLMIGNPGHWS